MATMADLLNNPALYLGLGLLSSGARRPETSPDPLASNMANMIGQYQQAQQMQQRAQQAQQAEREQERWMAEEGRLKQEEEKRLVAQEAVQNVLRQNPNAAPGDITRALLQATGDPSYLGQMSKAQERALMLNAGGGVAVLPPGATEPTFYQAPGGGTARGAGPQVREFKTLQGISTRQMTPTGEWKEVEFAPYGAREGAVAATKPAGAGTDLNTSEAKATTFYSQMRGAREVLGTLQDEGFNPESTRTQAGIMAAGNPATNVLAGEKAQRARQAQEQWAEAYLRFKTGAATNADEIRRNVRTFFPQLGDKAETVKQKAEARKRAEEDIALSAGAGAAQVRARPGDTGVRPITRPAGQPTVQTPQSATPDITPADIEFTARKHGISVEEVKRRLGIQ